jgi:hypothetical protein
MANGLMAKRNERLRTRCKSVFATPLLWLVRQAVSWQPALFGLVIAG